MFDLLLKVLSVTFPLKTIIKFNITEFVSIFQTKYNDFSLDNFSYFFVIYKYNKSTSRLDIIKIYSGYE